MTHGLKVLGLMLVAVFAATALSASAASAAEFTAAESPAKVNATNEGSHVFTAGIVGNISCKKATFTGEEFQEVPTKEVTVTPSYTECTFLGVPTTVKTNSCDYTFTEPTGTGPFTGKVDVGCPTGKTIEFEALGCRVKVPAQSGSTETGLGTVTYTNQENGTVKVAAKVSSIEYVSEGACNGLPGKHTDGVYEGTAIASGENELGETISVSVG
jgi:hypothetical protein